MYISAVLRLPVMGEKTEVVVNLVRVLVVEFVVALVAMRRVGVGIEQ